METFSALLAFVWGIHRSPLNSSHKGQRRGALMFSLISVWTNNWMNNRKAGDLRRYQAHYDVIVMERLGYVVTIFNFHSSSQLMSPHTSKISRSFQVKIESTAVPSRRTSTLREIQQSKLNLVALVRLATKTCYILMNRDRGIKIHYFFNAAERKY